MIFNITDPIFGARPDIPTFDNTPSIQSALNAAKAQGCGTVLVPVGRFFCKGSLIVGRGVSLIGEGCGPYEPHLQWAYTKTQGPTLCPTSKSGVGFINMEASDSCVQDLLITYPEQLKPNDPVGPHGPIAYPPTILSTGTNWIRRCTLTNSLTGIVIRCGRCHVQDCNITAYKNSIDIDDSRDVNWIENVVMSVAWGDPELPPFGTLDMWRLNNGIGLRVGRADGLQLSKILVFGTHTGIRFDHTAFSPGGVGSKGVSGSGSDVNLDSVRNGVIAYASEPRVGFAFNNLILGPYWENPGHAIWLPASTELTAPARISCVGGSIRHQWAKRPDGADWAIRVDQGGGKVSIRNMIGYDILLPRL